MREMSWSETDDTKEWDSFIANHGGSIFHTWAWRRVLETMGDRPFYLVCRDARGIILGACPFLCRKKGRGLRYLDSLPLSQIAGPLLVDEIAGTPEAINLLRKAVKFSILQPIIYMRLRTHDELIARNLMKLGCKSTQGDGLFILDLHQKTRDDIWNQGFEKHDRQAVKFYETAGSSFEFAQTEEDYLEYLALHEESVARADKPPLISSSFLRAMRLNLGDRLKVALIRRDDRVIAGFSIISDPTNSIIHLAIIGYSRAKNIHSPVVYIDWKAVNWAASNGFRYVNFGPTNSNPSNPIYRTKEKFGGRFVPRYDFELPTSAIMLPIARAVTGVFRRMGL
jgi:hypothetical protein